VKKGAGRWTKQKGKKTVEEETRNERNEDVEKEERKQGKELKKEQYKDWKWRKQSEAERNERR
jgi:hypothetical protein